MIPKLLRETKDELTEDENEKTMETQFSTVQQILDEILEKVPLARGQLLAQIASGFPNGFGSEPAHEKYIDNLFKLIERHKTLRSPVLETILVHFCRIDQHLPKNVLFDLDLAAQEESEELTEDQLEFLSARDTFDRIMIRFFQFIETSVASDDEVGQKNNVLVLLREMVTVFGKVLLPQPNTTTVQYVYFYLLSLKGTFSTSFCEWMLKRIKNKSESRSRRIALLSYLTSFLARAQFVSHTTLRHVALILSTLCIKDHQRLIPEKDQHFSTEKFGVYYATAQALFYLVIFRHKELGNDCIRSLGIPEIVYSKMNPLAACVPSIALKFCDIMKETQLAFCHHILEQFHERQLLATGTNEIVNPIDFYFPFDRCLLPMTAAKIDKFYNHWVEEDSDSEDEDSSEEEESDMES
ncbi:Oidioi.mRNA.OKI2018_I69.chr2.g6864.t2.cds [Oikopleura dioica]|uniref:Oidioi.mRNA.OKI2018_I69.chr2.g6864.t2.cds n=1 Tax=Oikopleura dioica TaxID=34765 RepID=A0ABN7TAX9_OIKDI|nr:Oidioi.mRNA.OKI2018_I69.chr2.g6864.t2.cds [Oikopleura dioica]